MNTLHIIGNLTGNPESRAVQGQNGMNTVCNFTVAVNRYVRGQKTTTECDRALIDHIALAIGDELLVAAVRQHDFRHLSHWSLPQGT